MTGTGATAEGAGGAGGDRERTSIDPGGNPSPLDEPTKFSSSDGTVGIKAQGTLNGRRAPTA